jgi:flagellar biosynthesis protein FliR
MSLELFQLGPLLAMELMIGLIIGYIASIPLIAVQTSGLIMGQQMGLGFARFYNPAIDDEADIIGQILFYLALAGFLLIGGHEAMVLAVLHSFENVPLGGFSPDTDLVALMGALLTSAFELALRVAAPLLAIITLESVAMGFIAKTVPQMNILSLGFPLRIIFGLMIIAIGLIVINEVVLDAIDGVLDVIFNWIDAQGVDGSGSHASGI